MYIKNMKSIILFLFLFVFKIFSGDYTFDSRGSSVQEVLKFADNSKYIHITTNGWWTDSYGNYGKEVCYGKIEYSNDEINLDIICELTDQEKKTIKVSRKRNSLSGGGVGINTYIETPNKYSFLSGKKCTYAVTFLNIDFFYKQRCIVK